MLRAFNTNGSDSASHSACETCTALAALLHSAHFQGSGRDSVLEKDSWLYLRHLATLCRFIFSTIKLTTSASCICFHTSSRRSSESVSSFDSYIETIEMQGVCPTWLCGLGCRGAHRSERLRIASLSTSLTSPRRARFHRQPRAQEHPGPAGPRRRSIENATALLLCTDTSV